MTRLSRSTTSFASALACDGTVWRNGTTARPTADGGRRLFLADAFMVCYANTCEVNLYTRVQSLDAGRKRRMPNATPCRGCRAELSEVILWRWGFSPLSEDLILISSIYLWFVKLNIVVVGKCHDRAVAFLQ